MNNETPIGLALIVWDQSIQDRGTNKRSLIGMFDRLKAGTFPCIHPGMCIFISLTSGKGEYDSEIVCRHANGKRVFAVKGRIRFQDPMQVVEAAFDIKGPRFETPGDYWVELLVDDVPVMMRRLFIEKLEGPPPGQNPPGQSPADPGSPFGPPPFGNG